MMAIAYKSKKLGKIHIFHAIFFSAGFRPLLSKIGGRTAAKFSRPIIFFLFGRFCVIWPNLWSAGNSAGGRGIYCTFQALLFDQVHGTFYPPISTNAISKASTPIS
jgi:hypothetical protein